MPRVYTLQPTPKDHFLYARNFYHEIRDALLDKRRLLASAPLPDLIDLTGHEPPIRDQGHEGACSGFQTRNVRMMAHALRTGEQMPDLSPAFAYWQARALDNQDDVDSGETLGNELGAMEAFGICEESFMPYVAGEYQTPPSQEALANALTHKVDLQAVPVDYSSFSNVHQVLADQHPIILGFSVPESFERCPDNGALPDPTGEPSLGGHAGSICALHHKDGWMRFPNSWGTQWGAKGFAYAPASYLGRIFEMWAIVPCL